jgi:hypothetical protein
VWRGAVEFGVAVQPAHWMVSLKSLTASSVPSVVLKGMLKVSRSVIRRRKKSQFVRRLLKRRGCSGGTACVVRSTMTREWSVDRSRLDVAAAEFGGIPFVIPWVVREVAGVCWLAI